MATYFHVVIHFYRSQFRQTFFQARRRPTCGTSLQLSVPPLSNQKKRPNVFPVRVSPRRRFVERHLSFATFATLRPTLLT